MSFVTRMARRTLPPVVVFVVGAALLVAVAPSAFAIANNAPDSTWQTNGPVRSLLRVGNTIYVGGIFTQALNHSGSTLVRNNVVAIDATTGVALASWNANASGEVDALAASPDGSTIYLGGVFTKVGGVTRLRLAAVTAATGALLAWNPGADAAVRAMAFGNGRVYIGGGFLTVGGLSRARLAAINPASGAVDPSWTANAYPYGPRSIVVAPDGRVLTGGGFTTIDGSSQPYLAALDPTTGAPLPWISHPPYVTRALAISGNLLVVAAAGGGGHVPAYDLATGALKWTAFGDGDAQAIAVMNGLVYVGGHFNWWGGQHHQHVVALDPSNGASESGWTASVDSDFGVYAMVSSGAHLFMGGDFTHVSGVVQQYFTRFTDPAFDTTPPTTPGQPSGVSNSPTSIDLSWAASSDPDNATLTYHVYRDGNTLDPIADVVSSSTTTVAFRDTNVLSGSTHDYAVAADDGVNLSPLSPWSDPIHVQQSNGPLLTSLVMQDRNANGKIDTVVVTFSENVTCVAPCTSPWTLAGVPSGASLASVAVSGNAATLSLTEGAGAPDTSVGSFTVALSGGASGVVDANGVAGSFGATAPADRAGPVPVNITNTNGSIDGQMQAGDTLSVTFSEPIDPGSVVSPTNIKEADQFGPGNDLLYIVGLTNGGLDTGSDGYITQDNVFATFQSSTLTLTNGGKTVVATVVAPCSGTGCGAIGAGASGAFVFVPEPLLRDAVGNGAVGSLTKAIRLF